MSGAGAPSLSVSALRTLYSSRSLSGFPLRRQRVDGVGGHVIVGTLVFYGRRRGKSIKDDQPVK